MEIKVNQIGKPPKKRKTNHNSCELSTKMENPPTPISQQFQPLSELENQCFFAIKEEKQTEELRAEI